MQSDNHIKSVSDRMGNCCWLNEIISIPQHIPFDENTKACRQTALWTRWSVMKNVTINNDGVGKPVFDKKHRACLVDLRSQKAEFLKSELTAIEFIDVPTGASVHPAENTDDGIWSVTDVDVEQIYYCPNPDQSGKCVLTVQLTAQENRQSDPVSMVVGVEVDLPALETDSLPVIDAKPVTKKLSVKQGKTVRRKNINPARTDSGKLSAKLSARTSPVKSVVPAHKPVLEATVKPAFKSTPKPVVKIPEKPALTARVVPVQKKPQQTSVRRQPVVRKPIDAKTVAPKHVTVKPKSIRPSVTVKANPIKKTAERPSKSGPDVLQNIILRLGASPEFGDPHYRIYVDGRQISSGNIDYSISPTVKNRDAEIAICWQDIVIPWPQDAATPSKLLIRYDDDQSGPFQQPRNMVVDYVMVAGIKMDPDGPYAFYPTARRPMGGRLDRIGPMSWDGDLIFNVTGALAGNPNLVIAPDRPSDVLNNKLSTNKPLDKITKDRVLNIQASDLDIHNPSVMAELREVRNYLRGDECDDEKDNKRKNTLGFLGVDKTLWSDLKVVAPDGSDVSLTPIPGDDDKGHVSVKDMELGRLVRQRFVERLMNKALSGAAKNIEARHSFEAPVPAIPDDVKITANNENVIVQSIIDKAQKLRSEFIETAMLSARKMSMDAKNNMGNTGFSQKSRQHTIDSGNRVRENFMTSSLQKTIKALEMVSSGDGTFN